MREMLLTPRRLVGLCAGLMVGLAIIASAASATVIVPATPGGTLPQYAQSGRLYQDVKCHVPILGSVTFTEQMSGTLATEFAPGQPFYISDGSGALTIPATFVDLLKLIGVSQATGSITTLAIDQAGGTPAVVNGATPPFVVDQTALVANQPLTIPLPQGGGSFTIGPFGVGASGVDVQTQGAAGGILNLQDARGTPLGAPITIACAAPDPRVIVNDEGIV